MLEILSRSLKSNSGQAFCSVRWVGEASYACESLLDYRLPAGQFPAQYQISTLDVSATASRPDGADKTTLEKPPNIHHTKVPAEFECSASCCAVLSLPGLPALAPCL